MDNMASLNMPDLGSHVIGNTQKQLSSGNWYSTILKYCSKERLLYIVTGIILLVCIYFYLKNKWSKKEEELENEIYLENNDQSDMSEQLGSESNYNLTPIEPNEVQLENIQEIPTYQTPPGYITIPVDTYHQLQENFVESSKTNHNSMEEQNMENNLSNEEDLELSKELSDFNNISRLESSDEEERTKAQDLTNTEIQSIQNQLNSFKTNNLM